MAKTRKTILPKNLAKYAVYISDTAPTSDYFRVTNLPQSMTGGRNSFLIGGSPYLQRGTSIQIEILDVEGNPIFYNPVVKYIEGTSRMITVEVNEATKAGLATIIIMGVAAQTKDGGELPPNWKNVYNVRWVGKVLVEPNMRNSSPLKLLIEPVATAEEVRLKRVVTSSYVTTEIPFTASLTPVLRSGFTTGYVLTAVAPTTFSSDHYNGTITGSMLIDGISASVELPISNILNKSVAFTDNHVIKTAAGTTINKLYLTSGSYLTDLLGSTVPVTASVKLRYSTLLAEETNVPVSYAKIRTTNLSTVSGEIFKIKVYSKPVTNISEYKLVADIPVVTEELLTTQSVRGALAIGNFVDSPNASTNWYADRMETGSSVLYTVSGSSAYYTSSTTVTPFTVSVDDTVLLRSMYAIVPTHNNDKFANQVSESGYFIGVKQNYTLFPTTEYTLELDAYYKKSSGSVTLTGISPKVDIYIVGSSDTKIVSQDPLGQKIGTLTVVPDAEVQWYQKQQFNFTPAIATSGLVGVRFVVSNGFWNFSNVSLKPASDKLFAPDEVQFLVPNTEYFRDVLQHKLEFFDINSNSTDITVLSTPTYFTGSAIDLGTLPPVVITNMYSWQLTNTPIVTGDTSQYWNVAIWVPSLSTWFAGGSRGIITSSNGLTWGQGYYINSGSTGTVNNLVWADSISKVVGSYSTTDGVYTRTEIITSSNGIDWGHIATIPKGPTESGLVYDLQYADDISKLLLVQGRNTDSVLTFFTSSNAATWGIAGTQDLSYGFADGLARSNNVWIAPGDTSGFFYTSSTGATWGTVATAANSNNNGVASNTGIYVAVAGEDTIGWSDTTGLFTLVSYGGFSTTAYNGTTVNEYTNGDSYIVYHLYSSPNGYTWTDQGVAVEAGNGWYVMATKPDGTILLLETNTSTGTDSAALGTYNL